MPCHPQGAARQAGLRANLEEERWSRLKGLDCLDAARFSLDEFPQDSGSRARDVRKGAENSDRALHTSLVEAPDLHARVVVGACRSRFEKKIRQKLKAISHIRYSIKYERKERGEMGSLRTVG